MFDTELDMSIKFEHYLKQNFGNSYVKECKGLFGIPDFLFYLKNKEEISIISFELKLKDWKRAAKQAFRYKSFSNLTYVVIPMENINAALNNIQIFEQYNIGLAKFEEGHLEIIFKPRLQDPFSHELTSKIKKDLRRSKKRHRNCDLLWN